MDKAGEEGRAQPLFAGQIVVFNWRQYSDFSMSSPDMENRPEDPA
jgi:hypothetical protein